MDGDEPTFYHAFPRRPPRTIDRGLRILKSVVATGLLLVPEVLEFTGEVDSDTGERGSGLLSFQRRFCLTHLARSELAAHREAFGPFYLAFSDAGVRRLGGVPAVYIPQPLGPDSEELDLLGNTIVHRVFEIQRLLDMLSDLDDAILNTDGDHHVEMESAGQEARTYRVDDLRWLFREVRGGSQGFDVLASAIRVISSFFVPTELSPEPGKAMGPRRRMATGPLHYYMQREWRIAGNIYFEDKRVDRELTNPEKQQIMSLDPDFFGRVIRFGDGNRQVIDACSTIFQVGCRPVHDLIWEIGVPCKARDEAKAILAGTGLAERVVPWD